MENSKTNTEINSYTATTEKAKIFVLTKIKRVKNWTEEEDKILMRISEKYEYKNWKLVSEQLPGRSAIQCSARYKRIRPGIVKGAWMEDEDCQVRGLLKRFGKNWSLISKYMPSRSGKQIRDRFLNTLDPNLSKAKFTEDEDSKILSYYQQLGTQWSRIALNLPGRTGDMIKNRFYSSLRKQIHSDDYREGLKKKKINSGMSKGEADRQKNKKDKLLNKKRKRLIFKKIQDTEFNINFNENNNFSKNNFNGKNNFGKGEEYLSEEKKEFTLSLDKRQVPSDDKNLSAKIEKLVNVEKVKKVEINNSPTTFPISQNFCNANYYSNNLNYNNYSLANDLLKQKQNLTYLHNQYQNFVSTKNQNFIPMQNQNFGHNLINMQNQHNYNPNHNFNMLQNLFQNQTNTNRFENNNYANSSFNSNTNNFLQQNILNNFMQLNKDKDALSNNMLDYQMSQLLNVLLQQNLNYNCNNINQGKSKPELETQLSMLRQMLNYTYMKLDHCKRGDFNYENRVNLNLTTQSLNDTLSSSSNSVFLTHQNI